MKPDKRERLERTGWRLGSAKDFLGLTAEEAALVEHRLERSTPVWASPTQDPAADDRENRRGADR